MPSGFSPYHVKRTASFVAQKDPRFSYCLYVPPDFAARKPPARLLVAIHGTDRKNQPLRDLFSSYAEANNTIVVCPLFPAGLGEVDDLDGYKYLRFHGIAFDKVVVDIAAEVAHRYGIDGSKFSLFGFSGGAQFSHRFFYGYPELLSAVVVGAPGSVTLPTEDYNWWPGLRGYESVFGRQIPWDQFPQVPIHLVVGDKDSNIAGTVQSKDHPFWVDGANVAGSTRVERLNALHKKFKERGFKATLETLKGVGHDVEALVAAACRYFEKTIS